MDYFLIDPEVAGQLGPETILIKEPKRPRVELLEYVFDGWLGDDLLQSYPCFIVTRRLADAIRTSGLTGYRLEKVKISRSEEFADRYPAAELPAFVWLQIVGQPGKDDFGYAPDNRLLVSQKALDVLTQLKLEHCQVERA